VSERNTALGRRLRLLRKQSGLTSQEVANAVGMTQGHLCAIERGQTGNPRLNILKGLADYYGLTVSELVGEHVEAKPSVRGDLIRQWFVEDLPEEGKDIAFGLVGELRRQYKDAR
jgi:transcriptional regulator with XRE-family HTH domain